MKYALVGHGQMGRAIDEQAASRGHRRVGLVTRPQRGCVSRLDSATLGGAEVAFEFTEPAAAADNVAALAEAGVAIVCGTTGWEVAPRLRERLERGRAGCIVAPNFSVGVNLFFRIVRQAAAWIGSAGLHEPFVEEVHHRGKRDLPSGTARRLADLVVQADPRLEGIQEGHPVGRLPRGQLQVVGIRVGSEPGTHTVAFDGPQDVITLRHNARDRTGFALGAVLAAEWLRDRPGLFTFENVLDELLGRTPPGSSVEEDRQRE